MSDSDQYLRDFKQRSWAKAQQAIDALDYTIAMREKDAEIDRLLPNKWECFCTGACQKGHEAYQGACVCVPRYHLAMQYQDAAWWANKLLNPVQPEPDDPHRTFIQTGKSA